MPLSSVVGAQSIIKPGVCTSSTRPASPFEGQMIYETDTDILAIWNGTAWRQLAAATKTGSVLQVASTTKTDTFTTTSTSFTDITGLSVTITPQSTSSKILISTQINGSEDYAVSPSYLQLVRGSTNINLGDAAGSRQRASAQFNNAFGSNMALINFDFLDSPATTSATTYKVQIRTNSGTAFINRTKTDSDNTSHARGASTITVMEIAG